MLDKKIIRDRLVLAGFQTCTIQVGDEVRESDKFVKSVENPLKEEWILNLLKFCQNNNISDNSILAKFLYKIAKLKDLNNFEPFYIFFYSDYYDIGFGWGYEFSWLDMVSERVDDQQEKFGISDELFIEMFSYVRNYKIDKILK